MNEIQLQTKLNDISKNEKIEQQKKIFENIIEI